MGFKTETHADKVMRVIPITHAVNGVQLAAIFCQLTNRFCFLLYWNTAQHKRIRTALCISIDGSVTRMCTHDARFYLLNDLEFYVLNDLEQTKMSEG